MCMHYHACTKTASENMLYGIKSSGWCSLMNQMDGMGRSGRKVPEGGNTYSRFTSLYSKNEHNIVLNKKLN